MLQILLSGIATGSVYGLIGMALAITFYVSRIINFSQGQVMMLAVMVTSQLSASGTPLVISLAGGVACAVVASILCYFIAVRPVLNSSRFGFGWLVTTLGFAVMMENAAAYVWGPTSQAFPEMLIGSSLRLGDATITYQQILTIVVAIIFASAFEFSRRSTMWGKMGMATSLDPDMAAAVGINTSVVSIAAFAISAVFAATAGLMIGPHTFANPYLGGTFGTYGFIAMMIGGGTERPIAAMLGGLLLGICAEGANTLINSQASDWFPFLVLVVVLVFSPRGLFSSEGPLAGLMRRVKLA